MTEAFDVDEFREEYASMTEEERLQRLRVNKDNFVGKVIGLRAHDDPDFLPDRGAEGGLTTDELAHELGIDLESKDK